VHYENQATNFIEGVCAPENSRNGKQYGISHIDVYVCAFDVDRYRTGDDCVNGGGG